MPGGGAGAPSPGPGGLSTPATPTKRRKNAAATPSLHKPKKQKLPRNLDSITARNQLPNVPAAGGVGKSGQRMVKGPYKKREKKDKDGKKIPAGAAGAAATSAAGATGGKKGKGAGKAGASGAAAGGAGANAGNSTAGEGANRADQGTGFGGAGQVGVRDDDGDDSEIRKPGSGPNGTAAEGGEAGAEGGDAGGEGKDEDDDDHEEEPEYTEYEWNQEASSRGRSKDELKYSFFVFVRVALFLLAVFLACSRQYTECYLFFTTLYINRALLDCFSDEQLQRYEVYRRSVLGRSTVKKVSFMAMFFVCKCGMFVL